MVRMQFSIELGYDIDAPGCDMILSIQAARTRQQTVVMESLTLSQPLLQKNFTVASTHTRHLRLQAGPGPLTVRYNATVDLDHYRAEPNQIAEIHITDLPGEVLQYVYPSRYCPSDRLLRLANKEFGQLQPGYTRVQAICNWVTQRVIFQSNTSNGSTTALDTLIDEVGVCRDFAHLMITLCRAVNIPARFVTGFDYGADPALGPPDFHAYVEVYVGQRWYLFDPSGTAIPMGFVRFATGRDAADCAFATLFGGVRGAAPILNAVAVPNALGELVIPHHVAYGLSTDS